MCTQWKNHASLSVIIEVDGTFNCKKTCKTSTTVIHMTLVDESMSSESIHTNIFHF